MKNPAKLIILALISLLFLSACQQSNPNTTTFIVTIENIAANGAAQSPLSPGVAIVAARGERPLFTQGQADRGEGLKEIAEVGNPSKYQGRDGYIIFNTPVDASSRGPINTGQAYRFEIRAAVGSSLSFATMLEKSKDIFIAPEDTGIPLFDAEGNAISSDVTSTLSFWDVGTKDNATGASESKPVAKIDTSFTMNQLVRVTIKPKQ